MNNRPRILLRSVLLATTVAAIAVSTVGCGQPDKSAATDGAAKGNTQPAADGMADSAATAAADLAASTPDPHDACRLVSQAEAEAFLGAPLASPPYLAGQPIGEQNSMPGDGDYVCWYNTADNHNFTVSANWENGGAINAGVAANLANAEAATMGLLKLQDGTELSGDWDEAKLSGCCSFSALQGDNSVDIDFGGSNASLEKAAELANKALGRLSALLPANGHAGQAAGGKRVLARYASEDPCALWSAGDITHLLGTPSGDPQRSGDDCTWSYRNKQGRDAMFVATVSLRNGYRLFRMQNATFADFAKAINAEGTGEGVQLRQAKGVEGPWEAAQDGPIQFNSVRKDISISLRQSGMSQDDIRAVLGHAYDRIDAGSKS